jgi:hypothetical protein
MDVLYHDVFACRQIILQLAIAIAIAIDHCGAVTLTC